MCKVHSEFPPRMLQPSRLSRNFRDEVVFVFDAVDPQSLLEAGLLHPEQLPAAGIGSYRKNGHSSWGISRCKDGMVNARFSASYVSERDPTFPHLLEREGIPIFPRARMPNGSAAIKRSERTDVDVYEGTHAQLMAAGIVRAEQFPPPGRMGVSYLRGVEVRGKCRRDETYLRVEQGSGWCRVHVGIPRDIADSRREKKRAADDDARRVQEEALRGRRDAALKKSREDAAADARSLLLEMPKTDDDFRRKVVSAFRFHAGFALRGLSNDQHGYSLRDDSLENIMLSLDAIVEQIMSADVELDHRKHLTIVARLHQRIAVVEGGIAQKLARITLPNVSLLAGENT